MFVDGALDRTLRGDGLVDEFMDILDDYVDRATRAGPPATRPESGAPLRHRRQLGPSFAQRGGPAAECPVHPLGCILPPN